MYKNKPYKRHVAILLIYIGMWILNLFIAPSLFILGRVAKIIKRTKEGKVDFWSWFINTDEPTVKENMYGDEKYFASRGIYDIESRNLFTKFWWYLKWNIVRNSFFYFKLHVITPKIGTLENIQYKINTTKKDGLKWCDYNDRGTIYTTYEIDGQKHFRYSHTKEVKLLWIWKRIQNVQFGASGTEDKNRYIYKVKHKKPNR